MENRIGMNEILYGYNYNMNDISFTLINELVILH